MSLYRRSTFRAALKLSQNPEQPINDFLFYFVFREAFRAQVRGFSAFSRFFTLFTGYTNSTARSAKRKSRQSETVDRSALAEMSAARQLPET